MLTLSFSNHTKYSFLFFIILVLVLKSCSYYDDDYVSPYTAPYPSYINDDIIQNDINTDGKMEEEEIVKLNKDSFY